MISPRDALVLVALGGALGTGARMALAAAVGGVSGLTFGVVLANVLGAMALGWLVVRLDSAGWGEERRHRLRLFAGVGVLGGFTTYSAFAVHSADLIAQGQVESAFWSAAGMLVSGLVAAHVGVALGRVTGPVRRSAGG